MLAIATFFGALVYLQLEKSTDIRRGMAGGGKQEGVVKPDPNRRGGAKPWQLSDPTQTLTQQKGISNRKP